MNYKIEPEQWIEGRYRLIEELDKGSYGTVWKAWHKHLHRYVAIKVIDVTNLSAENIERVERECRIGGKLNLSGVVRVLDALREDEGGYLLIVMDLMANDLATRIHKDTQDIPFAQAINWALDLCEALQKVHEDEEQIIHRDIKPQNILLDSNGNVKLCDFGIAHIKSSHSTPSQQPGTPAYKAPELDEGLEASPPADVYSLCAVLFELWSRHPYVYKGLHPTLIEKEFLEFLKTKHKDVPVRCRNMLAQAISGGLAPLEQRISLAKLQNELQSVQQCLDNQGKIPFFFIKKKTGKPSRSPKVSSSPPTVKSPSLDETKYQPPAETLYPEKQPLAPTQPARAMPSACVYSTHSHEVTSIAWSPNGVYIASADRSGHLYVWEASTTRYVFSHRGYSKEVFALAWSPDSQRLASVNSDNEVWVWDALTGENAFQCTRYASSVIALLWLADGLHIASALGPSVQIWNGMTGGRAITYRGHAAMVKALAWSPDGQRLASVGSDGAVHVWKAATGKGIFTYPNNSDAVIWSQDGEYLASICTDKTVQVWNVATRREVLTYRNHSLWVKAVAWSPDGRRIASAGSDGSVQVWNASSGDNVFVYLDHIDEVNSVTWSPDGAYIASASRDRTVQVWEAPKRENFWTYHGHADPISAVAWSPDGQRLASVSSDDMVHAWYRFNPARSVAHRKQSGKVTAVAWSPNNIDIALASEDGSVQVWNATTGYQAHLSMYSKHPSKVIAVAWSPDGRRIVSASDDGSVHVWEASNGKSVSNYSCQPSKVMALAWSQALIGISSIGKDGTVQLWEVNGRRIESRYCGHARGVTSIASSHDGKYLALAMYHGVKVWETTQGHEITAYAGHTSAVLALTWSPDGRYITSVSNGAVQIWNAFTGYKVASHRLHFGKVDVVAWSPNGQYIASAGDDKAVRIWQWQINK